MSGVIIDGVQWEHCNLCGKWVRIEDLGYIPNEADVCLACANKPENLNRVVPARAWEPVYG